MLDLTGSELKEVCSVLRTYIAHAKHRNKKDRLKSALNKLEIAESKQNLVTKGGYVTFPENNICSKCLQKVVPSTMEVLN